LASEQHKIPTSNKMNPIIDASTSLISVSSLSAPAYISTYCSIDRDMKSFEGYINNDDSITPLINKICHEEVNVKSCRIAGNENTNTNTVGINLNLRQQDFADDARRWGVVKISVLILIVFSLADVIIHMVDTQIESLEAHDYYDALSADVIRPAFRYHQDQSRSLSSRPSMGLGSAAISSVTTTLSPILPFTGGIDLRREDYWKEGWFGSFYSVVEHVRDAFEDSSTNVYSAPNDSIVDVLATPRGGAAVSAKMRTNNKPNTKKKRGSSTSKKRDFVLSNSECFVPLKEIAESTLKDISMSFRYAVESTQRDFNSGKFLSVLLPRVKKTIERMSTTIALARGDGVSAPITEPIDRSSVVHSGDIDAVNFCAAMRIFAEWRVLRQVPPGYKGYAVGIGLGQKDIVQNIAKIEHAIHEYVDRNSNNDSSKENTFVNSSGIDSQGVITSPTLRDLLQYEVDANVHDNTKLPRLKEKSAAMGLLWVRRQLVYQTEIFNNVLDVGTRFDSSRAAVQAAYDEVYGNLHGWAVQKIFSYSFQAAPEGIEIYRYMNPHRLEEVQQEARTKIMGISGRKKRKNDNKAFGRIVRHVGKEWDKIAGNVVNEWDKISDNVVNEWDKVTGNIGQLFGQQRHRQNHPPKKRRRLSMEKKDTIIKTAITDDSDHKMTPGEDTSVVKEQEMENFINQEMRKDAYEHIKAYLEVVNPLLDDLSSLIDEFNMDDPTKV